MVIIKSVTLTHVALQHPVLVTVGAETTVARYGNGTTTNRIHRQPFRWLYVVAAFLEGIENACGMTTTGAVIAGEVTRLVNLATALQPNATRPQLSPEAYVLSHQSSVQTRHMTTLSAALPLDGIIHCWGYNNGSLRSATARRTIEMCRPKHHCCSPNRQHNISDDG